ncbi:DUF2199 domain-containing protein [Hymenobacter sp. 15J16-1T3B]|uniref:DUF2199 domain-containing protein n=1 Tax=Hymenobacter sp. 15J16-1T3B TaxID=2886941 RepID=UPI001D11F2BE|nr:DUF2199 domain-containing protein [Hymenobacter sp. 15J16-1T3B]MCC3155613.1 DUF2199 domain-containing protein [Hymenobacter sp. 15J16-1T3B]
MSYHCVCCGQVHDGLPAIVADKPDLYFDIPEEEREQRVRLSADTCVIDDEHYFIRSVLAIPIRGQAETLDFGVWVSQKKEHFEQYLAYPDSADIGPFFGWFSTHIGLFAPTLNLKSMAHFQGGKLRPRIELEPTRHPLAVAQRKGITLNYAWRIAHEYVDLDA